MGVMRGYLCDRCPLAFEIGGYFFWSLDGRCEQAVCRVCGTMHRLTEQHGVCQVTHLASPVWSLPLVTRTTELGVQFQDYEWPFTEADWKPACQHPGGIKALEQLTCSQCGAAGQMQSLESFLEVCPLCGAPMPFLYDDTIN